jgi:hypothetical protein
MNVCELLLWYSVTAVLITLLALAIVILKRVLKRRLAFNERDWFALCGHTRQEVFSARLLLRFGVLWLCVVAAAYVFGLWIVPLGATWLLASLIPIGIAVVLATRWWMR